jgi:oligopeptide transport system permease protein
MIPVVIGTTFLIYTLVWFLPGDPFASLRPAACPDAYVALMTEFNLGDPLIVSYLKYLGGVLTGNFGRPSPA